MDTGSHSASRGFSLHGDERSSGAGRVVDEGLIADVTDRVVERLVECGLIGDERADAVPGRLMTASEVASRYRVHRGWVYANARRLGAIRLGSGPKAALRFDPAVVTAAFAAAVARPRSAENTGAPQGGAPKPGLLPIRGRPGR